MNLPLINLVVNIGEIKISSDSKNKIKVYGLGSCIAVIMYDNVFKKAGIAHVALHNSNIDKDKSRLLPGYFADIAVPFLFKEMTKSRPIFGKSGISVKIAGGANVIQTVDYLNIGPKNIIAVKDMIQKLDLHLTAEDVGGNFNRTVTVDALTGRVIIYNISKGQWEI